MKLTQLRALVEIDRTGSQTAAARALNVSQPALGLQIRALEDEFGVPLFQRTGRGMVLTAAGQIFKTHAEEILSAVHSLKDDMKRHVESEHYTVTLGTTPTPGKLLVPQLLRAVAAEPDLTLTVREELSSDLCASLVSREIDLALTYVPPQGPHFRNLKLASDTFILIGSPGTLGHGVRPVRFHDLPNYPLIMDSSRQATRKLIDTLAVRENVSLNVSLIVDSVSLKRQVILSEKGYAIVPRGLFREAIDQGRFDWCPIISPSIKRFLYLSSQTSLDQELFARFSSMIVPMVDEYILAKHVNWEKIT